MTFTNSNAFKLKTLAFFAIANGLSIFTSTAQSTKAHQIHLGFIYPISSNGKHAAKDTNNLSIHLLAGVSSVEKGPSFAGLTNVVLQETKSVQFAGFSNHIGKKSEGALFAGFLNTYGSLKGVSFAGFGNFASGNVVGAQFAGFSNIAKDLKGSQMAGFANIAKNLKGSQFAGFSNIAKNGNASQFAGFINVAKDIKGSQFGGFINVAKNVKGAQVAGFINIATTSDTPIGLINIIKNGEMGVALTYDENETGMLTFRSGGKVLYGIIGGGHNFKNRDEVYAFEAGFGAHFLASNSFRLNLEATASTLESFKNGEYFKTTLRVLPALKLGNHLELFAGPSLNLVTTNTVEGKALHQKNIKTWQGQWSDFRQTLFVGYNAGIQFIF